MPPGYVSKLKIIIAYIVTSIIIFRLHDAVFRPILALVHPCLGDGDAEVPEFGVVARDGWIGFKYWTWLI